MNGESKVCGGTGRFYRVESGFRALRPCPGCVDCKPEDEFLPATLDAGGYPTKESLDRISKWEGFNFVALLAFVRSIWKFADHGYWTEDGGQYEISTGGWSGNEDLVEALQGHQLFWTMCWRESRRGGHYVFTPPAGDSAATTRPEGRSAAPERRDSESDRSSPVASGTSLGAASSGSPEIMSRESFLDALLIAVSTGAADTESGTLTEDAA